ncbi:hypothetical protein BH18THE2_BH18THE2_09250 [soil metagenome]
MKSIFKNDQEYEELLAVCKKGGPEPRIGGPERLQTMLHGIKQDNRDRRPGDRMKGDLDIVR